MDVLGLVVSYDDYIAFDAATEDFYEDPGPGRNEIANYDETAIRIHAFRALRGEIESEMLTDRQYVAD